MQDMVGIGGFARVSYGHGFTRPRPNTRREAADFPPFWERRAQGRPGVRCARSLVCKGRKHTS
jgi:hypothetical protein